MKKNNIILLLNLVFISLMFNACSSIDNTGRANTTQVTVTTDVISDRKTMEKKESKEEYYILRGINYVREENYTKALKEYEKAYQKNENNIITLKEIGRTYIKLKDYDRGIYYYNRALKIDSKDQESLRNIGYTYYLKGDNKKSLEYLNRLSSDGMNQETLKLKSYLLYKKKDYKEAYKNFRNIFVKEESRENKESEENKENNNLDLFYYKIYTELLNDMGKKEELRVFLEKKLDRYSSNREYVIFYSYALGEYFGEYPQGEREIKRYIVSYGGNDALYIALAYMIYNQKEYSQAESAMKLVSYKERYNKDYLDLEERLRKRI